MGDKRGLLPKLTVETMGRVMLGLDHDADTTYSLEVLGCMKEENPVLEAIISNFTKDMKEKVKCEYLVAMVYRMLEAQAEADYLVKTGDSKTN